MIKLCKEMLLVGMSILSISDFISGQFVMSTCIFAATATITHMGKFWRRRDQSA
jgi:hypothetical protein